MARSIFIFNTHDLPHRAGEMREYELDLLLTESVGVDLLSVKPGEVIELDLRIQSVDEGVLATGELVATATGECTRCLEPIIWPLTESFTELYYYESAASKNSSKKKGKERSRKDEEIDLEEDDLSFMDGDEIDLELAIRDAIILNLDVNPLCREDCSGLCQVCGQMWINLPADHAHTPDDPRWAALKDCPLKS
jgi:uncharacterized protein